MTKTYITGWNKDKVTIFAHGGKNKGEKLKAITFPVNHLNKMEMVALLRDAVIAVNEEEESPKNVSGELGSAE